MLGLAKAQGCKLFAFEHTAEEISGVLDSIAGVLKGNSTKAVKHDRIAFCIAAKKQPSDLVLAAAKVEDSLQKLGIEVCPSPSHKERLGIDETGLDSFLQTRISYRRETARRKDIDSLSAIHRLRNGEHFRTLEKCKAIFVTTNDALVDASREFFAPDTHDNVPLCVNDYTLATLLWLKHPLSAPAIPRQMILADCYAAMNPSDALWRRYIDEIEKLRTSGAVSDRDYFLLRYDSEARAMLVRDTLSIPDNVSPQTPLDILEKSKRALVGETTDELALTRLTHVNELT